VFGVREAGWSPDLLVPDACFTKFYEVFAEAPMRG
jgi:hypothetical protein